MTCIVKILDKAKLNALTEADAGAGVDASSACRGPTICALRRPSSVPQARDAVTASGLPFPAALRAAHVLPLKYSAVFALEQDELLALVLGRCGESWSR